MTNIYVSASRGPVEIDTMNAFHLDAALAKLKREQKDGERQDEIDALSKRLADIAEEIEAL